MFNYLSLDCFHKLSVQLFANIFQCSCELISIDYWLLTAYQRFRPNGKQEVLSNSNRTNFPVNTFSSLFHVESYCDGSISIVTKPTTNSINFHNFVFVKMFHEFSNCFAVDYVTISIANGKFSGWFETVTTDLFWYSISLFRQRNEFSMKWKTQTTVFFLRINISSVVIVHVREVWWGFNFS